jgi:hypothetical protein
MSVCMCQSTLCCTLCIHCGENIKPHVEELLFLGDASYMSAPWRMLCFGNMVERKVILQVLTFSW